MQWSSRFYGVMAITLDFESNNPSSNLGRTCFLTFLVSNSLPNIKLFPSKIIAFRLTSCKICAERQYFNFKVYHWRNNEFHSTGWRFLLVLLLQKLFYTKNKILWLVRWFNHDLTTFLITTLIWQYILEDFAVRICNFRHDFNFTYHMIWSIFYCLYNRQRFVFIQF